MSSLPDEDIPAGADASTEDHSAGGSSAGDTSEENALAGEDASAGKDRLFSRHERAPLGEDIASAAGPSCVEDISCTGKREVSLRLTRTTECAGCGRRFVGSYCPSCGQKAQPLSSAGSVAENFVRELFDIERGFLETVVALTTRPHRALRAYLSGDRTSLMSPGRYLLASIIVNFGVYWGLRKAGLLRVYGEAAPASSVESVDGLQSSFQALFSQQETLVLLGIAIACLIALVTSRLFRRQITSGAEAAALGCFLVGHASILEAGAAPAFALGKALLSGAPADPSPYLPLAVYVPYIWGTLWLTFGQVPWAGLKSAMAVAWATAELSVVSTLAFCGWGLWATSTGPADIPEVKAAGLAATGALALAVLLGHVGAEVYLRRT